MGAEKAYGKQGRPVSVEGIRYSDGTWINVRLTPGIAKAVEDIELTRREVTRGRTW